MTSDLGDSGNAVDRVQEAERRLEHRTVSGYTSYPQPTVAASVVARHGRSRFAVLVHRLDTVGVHVEDVAALFLHRRRE